MKKGFLIIALVMIIFVKNTTAFGVAYSDFLCPERPLQMFPGEEKTVDLWLQNMVGNEDISLAVKLNDQNGIAKIKEKIYNVKTMTEDTNIPIEIKVPEEAIVGSEYGFSVSFDTTTSGEGGGVALGTGMDVKVCVEIVSEQTAEPQLSPIDKNIWWIIGGMTIFILIVVVVVLIVLKRKNAIT